MTQRSEALDDAALTAALTAAFTRLTADTPYNTDAVEHKQRIGIAVSGGPDSMALLALSAAAWPGRIAAATLDHGLRPQSAYEAQLVAQYCAVHTIRHDILTPDQPITGNLQSSARDLRYRMLDQWRRQQNCAWLLTAHHADDQLETILMRLNRGSGVAGLAGIRARTGCVLRPLLNVGKHDLLSYCRRHAIPFVDDPSNQDARFDRARLRSQLAACDWLDAASAAQSASALADAETALAWAAAREAKRRLSRHNDAIACDMSAPDVPHEVIRRIIMLALSHIEPEHSPRGAALERLIAALQAGQTVTQGNVLCRAEGTCWRFSAAPPRAGNA